MLNVRPIFPPDYVFDCRPRDAIATRNTGNTECSRKISNFQNLRFIKLCNAMIGAFGLAPFFNLVGHVILLVSKKNMVRIYALGIVAFMAGKKRFWNLFNKQSISNPICLVIFSRMEKYCIAIRCFCSDPFPAISELWSMGWNRPILVDLFPKPLNVLFGHKNKTPVELEVNPAQKRRQQVGRALNFRSLFFMAGSMPEGVCHV